MLLLLLCEWAHWSLGADGWSLGADGWVCWGVGWPGPGLTAGVTGEVRGAGWSEELHGSRGLWSSYTGGLVQCEPRSCRAGIGPEGAEGARGCGGPASGPEQAKAAALGR